MKRGEVNVTIDIVFILLSIIIAWYIASSSLVEALIERSGHLSYMNSFVSGLFFTSAFTTAPAIVALNKIALSGSVVGTAFFGAIGAMCGDFFIFTFMKKRFARHLGELKLIRGVSSRLGHIVKKRFFHWFTLLLGGIIIASPLPDELGLSLLGFSKIKNSLFLPLSFLFNFIGIIIVILIGRGLTL